MIELTVHQTGNLVTCFHFQQTNYVVKLFVFELGTLRVHLCPQCAEQLASDLLGQLQNDQEVNGENRFVR